jgi:hypothetical protein
LAAGGLEVTQGLVKGLLELILYFHQSLQQAVEGAGAIPQIMDYLVVQVAALQYPGQLEQHLHRVRVLLVV